MRSRACRLVNRVGVSLIGAVRSCVVLRGVVTLRLGVMLVCLSFMLSIVSPVFAYVPPGVSGPVSGQSLLFLGARR